MKKENALKSITVLLPKKELELIEKESETTGINKGVLLRSIIMKHNQNKGSELK